MDVLLETHVLRWASLVDVGVCRRGPFFVLQKNADDEFYAAAYQIDEPGRQMLVMDARLVGQCSTCTGGGGGGASGLLQKGYRAEITGIVESVGEGEFQHPHKIQVQSVRSSSFADDICTAGTGSGESVQDARRTPSLRPTVRPTNSPTNLPSDIPSMLPSDMPSNIPSMHPSSSS